jgi:glutamate-1-semialdehyde 2,1-aminomutase
MTKKLFDEAKKRIPGGVNSPVRAFKAVSGTPLFINKASGPYLYDSEDKKYLDYVGSWGPMILGHAHPEIVKAVNDAAKCGLSFGAPTEIETQMANKICDLMPSIEKIRMVNSGTEAAMSAIRLARGYTGRDIIIKFEGCYHGHTDSLLVKAGSGALTFGVPTSPGVPTDLAKYTVTLTYNDIPQLQDTFEKIGNKVAAVIIEPIAGNMSLVPGNQKFLNALRALCNKHQSVLIFDEVMTGFRVALGGAQSIFNITPDITILGKIIGGGMPVGAFGGKENIMNHIAPDGPIYQAGTLSGNPVAMSAGLTTLNLISSEGFFNSLEHKTKILVDGITKSAKKIGVPLAVNYVGGMFGLFFTNEKTIDSFEKVINCNKEHYNIFFHGMLEEGIYLAPSSYEAGFVSSSHSDDDIKLTIDTAEKIFKKIN